MAGRPRGRHWGRCESIVHGLRGWPTPYGAAINSAGGLFEGDALKSEAVASQLATIGEQVLHFHRLAKTG